MARPHKQNVAYFPHDTDASDGRTLTIIQSKYGNDGYSFWFQLLELLGRTSGHYYTVNEPADWEFLLAKTHQSDPEKARDILATLVLLGAIDSELYSHGVIWCENLVKRVAHAYNRSVCGVPMRPDFLVNVGGKGVSVLNNAISTNRNAQNAPETSQRDKDKDKDRDRDREMEKDKDNGIEVDTKPIPSPTSIALLENFPKSFGRNPNSRELAYLRDIENAISAAGATAEQVYDAYKEAATQNKLKLSYVRAIIFDWLGIERKMSP